MAIAWLFACKWASLQNPAGQSSILALFSYSTVFAYLINLLFILFWLFTNKKWRSLLSFITIISLFSFVKPLFGFNYLSNNRLNSVEGNFKIMSWNVHMFDLGAWNKDEATKSKIIDLINTENPDILCLQEFYQDSRDPNMPYTDIIRGLGYPYVSFSKIFTGMKNRITINASKNETIEIGNVIFSKFPIEDVKIYDLGVEPYNLLSANIEVNQQKSISLNVVHLTSVNFGEEEMEYIEGVKSQGLKKENNHRLKVLLRKLTLASESRAILANNIDSLKRFMDHPIIICGDFNDVPSSYSYQKIKGDLEDPFVSKGIGFGRTFREISPTLRIDHILYDKKHLKVIGYGRRSEKLSDHYPVIANFKFREK